MGALLGNLVFLNPWVLAALIALPALWFLLRVMPPAPRRVFLPSTTFLAGLVPESQTPSHTPWWILLLRLLIAALLILAFAQPVLNPSNTLSGHTKIRIVLENGWGAAHLWGAQTQNAVDILTQAERENREIVLVTTAPEAGSDSVFISNTLNAAEAQGIIKGLSPLPWPSDYAAVSDILENLANSEGDIHTYWFSHGLDGVGVDALAQALQKNGPLTLLEPAPEDLPLLLDFDASSDFIRKDVFTVKSPENIAPNLPITLQVLGDNGRVLSLQNLSLNNETRGQPITLDIPATIRGDIRSVKIAERTSAGSMLILGDAFDRKTAGIVSPLQDSESRPFIEASYYLTRALEPYADIKTGTLEQLLTQNVSLMILPDIGGIPPANLNRLEAWVRSGGLLLRFAGPAMSKTRGQNFLTPVPLRTGKRALGGALSWDSPPKLSSFPENSPFYGLEITEDITIREQLLAEPSQDLPQKTWATLDDGTPLITASPMDQGLLVMVHTAASPDWSDLPLSGMFVQILRRLTKLAGAATGDLQNNAGILQPLWVLDGFGQMREPDSSVKNIESAAFDKTHVSSKNPPGLYGRGGVSEPLNLAPQIDALDALPDLGGSVMRKTYGQSHETDLMPALLMAAFILLLIDWAVMLLLSLGLQIRRFSRTAPVIAVLLAFAFAPLPALAEVKPSDLKYAEGLYLAYIKTSNSGVNALTHSGLEGLSAALKRRTSAEPEGIAALDPETDTLSFFPLIYWPITAGDSPLSARGLANIQSYLDHGGTILFDTRDHNTAAASLRGTPNADALQRVASSLNIPPLAPIPEGHVLGKSFYLLSTFPGRHQGGTLWVETTSANSRDGVSSVIIGSHDWAGAWAESQGRDYRAGTRSRQRELAVRFGVNVVMYALTGNYKADQVHVENILERLGQ